jgi:hypothetical protein
VFRKPSAIQKIILKAGFICIVEKIDQCHRNRNSAMGTVCRISVLKKQELFNYFYLSQGNLKISKPFTESTDLTEKSFTKIFN